VPFCLLTDVDHRQADGGREWSGARRPVETGHPAGALLERARDPLQPLGVGGAPTVDADDEVVAGGGDGGVAAGRATSGVGEQADLGVPGGIGANQIDRAVRRPPVGHHHLGGPHRASEHRVQQRDHGGGLVEDRGDHRYRCARRSDGGHGWEDDIRLARSWTDAPVLPALRALSRPDPGPTRRAG
jgi:hypothetical protein